MPGELERAPRRDDLPPSIAGYEILEHLGRGSSGVVYRARSTAVDREVAIKILHGHLAGDSRVARRLQREARTTARLAHPHIVSAVDMGLHEGRAWYAMEFVDGPSLAQRLRAEGKIREREALRLFIPLCEALEHLWEHGVVHRDIKPANILIDRTGGARLADLGLAFAEDDPSITGTGGTLGTPHYISPEQAIDSRRADARSDIWSFGATLFHAVCGRPPFAGESAAEVISAVLYARIPDPQELEPSLSRRLALVLRKCLTRDPERRYTSPRELLLDLERVRERRAPHVRKSTLDPLQRPAGFQRRLALGLGAGGLALLAACLFLLPGWLRGDPAAGVFAPDPSAPYAPLEELVARRARGESSLAEALAELGGMQEFVPPSQSVRHAELVRSLEAELRREVRAARDELEQEFDRALSAGDLAAAWNLYGAELEPRFQRRTGYDLEGLEGAGLNLGPWRVRLSLELQAATDVALSDLEAALQDWRTARLAREEACLAQQDWNGALEALVLPAPGTLLAEAGFKVRLPQDSLAGLLDQVGVEFRVRTERLRDEWQALDRALRTFVVTRRSTLERTLRESQPRIPAAEMLRDDFERELFDRRLSRERMPLGLSRAALEELEASARLLLELEDRLLEDDARADFAEVAELARPALRARDYALARELWSEARERLGAGPRWKDSPARVELARRMDLRAVEAGRLEALLERVAERIRELDGETIELRWGAILYPSARIRSGGDPLRDGFHAGNIPGLLEIPRLPSLQIEAFADLPPEGELEPEERVVLALFRFHEGRVGEARQVLFSGPLPADGALAEVGPDLADRIADELERADLRADEREREAQQLLGSVMDSDFQAHSPRVALARIARLLDEYGDLQAVRPVRPELLRLRAQLEQRERPDDERELRRVFRPQRLELSPQGRVKLHYDFADGERGGWEPGDWLFDGLGLSLSPASPVLGWDEVAAQRGLRLVLSEPFDPDNLELVLRFEATQGDRGARLFWLTAVGFQIALTAGDLPGTPAGQRFLIGTDEPRSFLQRVVAGEGRRAEPLLIPGGPPHELRFRASRRAGRCELLLDDVLLEQTSGLRAPGGDPRSIVLRSWGTLRVLSATVEGGR